jgi:RHS repeat-associated protein
LSSEGFAYEAGGLVKYQTNALGGVTTTLYTTNGLPKFRSYPDGATNGWRYYLDGRIKQEIQGNGAYWLTTYDDVNRLTTRTFYSATGAPLATNSFQLDRRGNVILRTDEGGNTFGTTYDGLDRVRMVYGPQVVTITTTTDGGMGIPGTNIVYVTNILQQAVANYYDAAGQVLTNVNALGEWSATSFDALGRATQTQVFNADGSLARQTSVGYAPDFNSVTVTNGSGASAIISTSFADNDGHNLLSIGYPSGTQTEFMLRQFDLAGNLVSEQHNSSTGGSVTTWTTASMAYDGLNRVINKTDRDGAFTSYGFDALGDVTNETLPGGLQWRATYNNAGQRLKDWNVSGSSGTRSNTYAYFSSGSPFAGLLQTRTDGRNTTCTYAYDDWLRVTNLACSGTLPEQNLTTTWQYEPRGFATNIIEQFASTNTGPDTSIERSFDAYGQLASESVSAGSFAYDTGLGWDAAGRRNYLAFGGNTYGFGWRADGTLSFVSDSTGGGSYGYDSAGMLTNRIVGNRMTSITSRDGEGRPLAITTTVNLASQLSESLSWSGDGLLASHTLVRGDFTDSRSYAYASLSRRLTQEQLNLNASTTWTNSFVFDNGTAAGPGVLTSAGQSSALWSGAADAFSRVSTETNNVFGYSAYGHVNGQATLYAWLDGLSVPINAIGTNAMQWQAAMELSSGTHQLKVAALHPSGFYTAWATNSFTNNIAYESTAVTFDKAGYVTNRVWKNPSGTVERTQSLSWDAKGRLHQVVERDASNNGQNFTVVYDALGRRLQTTQVLVTNGVAFSNSPVVVNHYFDPLYEFQELGVTEGSKTTWKLMGPDMDGQYGGQNGTGGLEGTSPYLNTFNPTIADVNGNILATVTNGVVSWNGSRVTAYGAVPNYRPLALGSSGSLAQKYAWRDRATESIGLTWLGANWYDPVDGRFLSPDPLGHADNITLYDFCGGNPLGYWDADGRFGKMAWNMNQSVERMFNPVEQASHMLKQAWGDYWSAGGGISGINLAYNRNNPFTPLANLAYREDILTGEKFKWWGDYSENIGHLGLNTLAAIPVAQVARETDVFTSQASTITREMEMFNPGELMPNGQIAGVGPGAQYVGEFSGTPSIAPVDSAARHAAWASDLNSINATVERLGQRALRQSGGDWRRSEQLFENYLKGVQIRLMRTGSPMSVEIQPAAIPGLGRVPAFRQVGGRIFPTPRSRRLDAGIVGPNGDLFSGFDITLNPNKPSIVPYYQQAFGDIPIFDIRLP